MRPGAVRAWRFVHTWTSLVCTLFLLVLCVTGLPLVFKGEIDDALRREPPYPAAPAGARADLGRIAEAAQAAYPRDALRTLYVDDAAPQVGVIMTPTADASFRDFHVLFFDARTGALRYDERKARRGADPMVVVQRVHTDLLAGLPGELFLGAMAVVFLGSLASGVALYGPFMRKLPFGVVRRGGAGRLAWLDLHNLVGVTALVWMLVVGATGALNAVAGPLFSLWTNGQAADAPRLGPAARTTTPSVGPQAAVDAARAAAGGGALDFVTYPSRFIGSPRDYVVWLKGDRTLTSRLSTPVRVDAVSGGATPPPRMPWYLRAVEVSRPLHFGDYGGLPLKALWAALDLLTIGVLATGLYLWVAKRRWSWRPSEREAPTSPAGADLAA